MVDIVTTNHGVLDLSFMASIECDLSCAHCMYNSSPNTKDRLDLKETKNWVTTVNWDQINSCGFYGGEPSILLSWYQKFVDLVPIKIPKFVITNGVWSKSLSRTLEFLAFACHNEMQVIVSGTKWHRPYQDVDFLQELHNEGWVRYKGEESNIIPMGKANLWNPIQCSQLCLKWNKPYRVALTPPNNIIFQSCDGSYPIIQNTSQSFNKVMINIQNLLCKVRTKSEPQCIPFIKGINNEG